MKNILLLIILLLTGSTKQGFGSTLPHKTYLPLVHTPQPENGMAWAGKRYEGDDWRLGVQWFFVWSVQDLNLWGDMFPQAQYIPYFNCDKSPPLAYGKAVRWYNFDKMYLHIPADYSGWLMYLNESDLDGSNIGGQCQRTPREAMFLYQQIITEYPNAKIVGPAVSHIDYLHGWPWLREFYDLLTTYGLPYPEVSAIHTYLNTEPAQKIVDSHFQLLAQYPGAPTTAWVTEYGSCVPHVVENMLDTWQTDNRITRWAYFAPRLYHENPSLACLSLFDSNTGNGFSAVGQAYMRALHDNKQPQWPESVLESYETQEFPD